MEDIIFGATNESLCKDFSKLMQAEFKMSMMEESKFFPGLQIKQTDEGIYINQTKYMKELLKKFKMDDAKQMRTPMHPTIVLRLDEELKKVDEKTYRGMMGSLMYLTASKPEITFNVCLCASFQKEPREVNLFSVKHIFRYLIGTHNLDMCFKREKEYGLHGYCDADFGRDRVERKSTSGGCHFIGGCLVSWTSKKQGTIALSTIEVMKILKLAKCRLKAQVEKDEGLSGEG